MPGDPPYHAPGRDNPRGSTRPGARREPRRTSRSVPDAEGRVAGGTEGTGDAAATHARARSRVVATLALGATHRIIALTVTIAVLAITFVSSLSVFFDQQREIIGTKAAVAAQEAEIARLQDQLLRWQDPAYIRAQARDRLGWVMPGEVGYRVIDETGHVIGGTAPAPTPEESDKPTVWYDVLWQSLVTADQPAPEPEAATEPTAPITVGPEGETPR